MGFKSVAKNFEKVKETLVSQANAANKAKTKTESNTPEWLFKPQLVKGTTETVFKIRFLPIQTETGMPWVEMRYHMFERPGDNKYVRAIDPRCLDKNNKNPIYDYVQSLYNTGNELDKKKASVINSKKRYFTLVYVKDAPEDQQHYVGKVLVYEAGVQVYKKMENAINKFDLCFWDPFEGTDFVLSISETGDEGKKYPSYLSSDFARNSGPIVKDEEKMDEIAKEVEKYDIKQLLIDNDGIKTPEELLEMLNGGLKSRPTSRKEVDLSQSDNPEVEESSVSKKKVEKKAEKPVVNKEESPVESTPSKKKEEPAKKDTSEDELGDINFDDINFDDKELFG